VRGEIVETSEGFERLTGLTSERARGLPLAVVLDPLEAREASLRELGGGEWAVRVASWRQGDDEVWGLLDLTRERRVAEQIRQTEKMEAVAQLANGVAHDFNNLLTVIGGNVLLLTAAELPDESRSYAREIAAAAERAGALTRQLLTFSRHRDSRQERVDANALLRGVAELVEDLDDAALDVALEPADGEPEVVGDPLLLEQMLLSLVVNARDAMPHGGRLVLGVSAAGHSVEFVVRDTGVGMDEPTRSRAFEPFFTTKESGQGTGLGLSTVYGIVRRCGGEIAIESAPGAGTTVVVTLPAAPADSPGAVAADAASAAPKARVLLVDDEPAVRRVAGMALERAGHELLLAAGGHEALELLSTNPRIDLLVTDLVMPGMNGKELAEHVRSRYPGLPVLYISGFADEVLGSPLAPGTVDILEKPFAPSALTQRVAAALSRSGPPV
jgi:two-component system cell cycle sensor histidine kinase/response regulator CckA